MNRIMEFALGVVDCMKRAVVFAFWCMAAPFIAVWWALEFLYEVWKY